MSAPRPRLLFVSPLVPSLTGNGLAMRAASTLMAMTGWYDVSLLVAARFESPAGSEIPPLIGRHCRQTVVMPARDVAAVSIPFDDAPFDVLHVFRLGTVPSIHHYLDRAFARRWRLDLDDLESTTLARIAALYRAHGEERQAALAGEQAREATIAERDAAMRFDRLFICADDDVANLPLDRTAAVTVFPNTLTIPSPVPRPPRGSTARILFVGSLGYLPNAEGIRWFLDEVAPVLRDDLNTRCEIAVAGVGSHPFTRGLGDRPGVVWFGPVPDVRPWYAWSDLVVAPIRAGGGTRIKIIEAFALRRPVVSTTIGAEGLACRDGEQLLIADDARVFAAACRRIIDQPNLADGLVERAYRLFSERYTDAAVSAVVAALADADSTPPLHRVSRSDDRPPVPK